MRDNSGPSTACKGGKGPGPPQGTSDHNPPYQVTQPPPPNNHHHHLPEHDKKIKINKSLNLYNSKNIKKKWRELKLTSDKKFDYILIVDYGVATTTNDKKRKRLRQEKAQKEKTRLLKSADNREIVREMCARKRQDFFTKLGGMKDRDEEDKNKKRKRDAEVRQDENKDKKKTRMEDNRGDKNHRPDASEFQGFQFNLTRKVGMIETRNEMHGGRASHPQVQGGKVQQLKNIFQNSKSKEYSVLENVRGQNSCLAVPTNRMQDNISTASQSHHAIGGNIEAKTVRTNENVCKKTCKKV